MKKGWVAKSLGEIADVEYGFTDKSTDKGYYRYIRITDIDDNGELISTDKKYIKHTKEAEEYLINDCDLLMARTGATFAKVLLCNISEPSVFASYLIRIKFKETIENKLYWYYSKTRAYWEQANSLVTGAAQPQFNGAAVKKVVFTYPKSISEQQRVVAILDKAFAVIDKAKANTEKNLQNVRALFRHQLKCLFEKYDDIWEKELIKDVCVLKSGSTISSSLERTEGDVLYVKVGDMNLPDNEVEINTSSRFVNSREINLSQVIPNGAIIFPKRGGAIATNKKRRITKPTIVDLNTMAIIPGSRIDANYFFHWFQLIDLNTLSNGSSIPQINNYSFDEVEISFPKSIIEQKKIVSQLDYLQTKIQKLEAAYLKKVSYLDELRKSILQTAFTGEL